MNKLFISQNFFANSLTLFKLLKAILDISNNCTIIVQVGTWKMRKIQLKSNCLPCLIVVRRRKVADKVIL